MTLITGMPAFPTFFWFLLLILFYGGFTEYDPVFSLENPRHQRPVQGNFPNIGTKINEKCVEIFTTRRSPASKTTIYR
jgi:hypothetical protein